MIFNGTEIFLQKILQFLGIIFKLSLLSNDLNI
jgi:hypothetical protein